MASRKRSSAWFRVGLVGIGLLGLVLVAQAYKHSFDRQSPRSSLFGQAGGIASFAVLRDAAPPPRRATDI